MERPPVSIVIPVWNAWPCTKQCLESLRPTLGVRDEIIIVDNGSTDGTSSELRKIAGLHVLTNKTNLGFAKACNQGAEIAKHEIVLFLNNDTVLAKGWIDELVAPFADPEVGATGPRSNNVSGEQKVEEADYARDIRKFREFAREWMQSNRGRTSEADRLVGFCLAVRKTAFDQVGYWDEQFEVGGFEDDDLCDSLIDCGWKLLVCHGSFVHHHGSQTFAANEVDQFGIQELNAERYVAKRLDALLISACLIVRDEALNIAKCIESLKNFVDEIVVYDTGSTDTTVGIARGLGAKVTMGYWSDDFARARNTALDLCTGTWILQIDADERLEVQDSSTLRSQLMRTVDEEVAFVVPITNYDDAYAGGDVQHRAVRLFTREQHQWEGRLHEKVVRRDFQPVRRADLGASLHIRHYGYTKEAIATQNKAERNVRLAKVGLSDAKGDIAEKKLNLVRSLMMTGQHSDALFELKTMVATKEVLRCGIEAQIELGEFDGALEWIESLSKLRDEEVSIVHYLRGQVFLGMQLGQEALVEFDLLKESSEIAAGTVWFRRGLAHAMCEQWNQAFTCFNHAIEHQYNGDVWPAALEAAFNSENMNVFFSLANAVDRKGVLSRLLKTDPEYADALAELCWDSQTDKMATIEFASYFAYKLSHQRALEWSTRFRENDADEYCPLLAMATDAEREGVQRVQAAVMANNAFGDERSIEIIRVAVASVADDQLVSLMPLLFQTAPLLVKPYLENAATTSSRALLLADALQEHGVLEGAVELRNHASNLQSISGR